VVGVQPQDVDRKLAVLHPDPVEVGPLEQEQHPVVEGEGWTEHEAHRAILVLDHHLALQDLARGRVSGMTAGGSPAVAGGRARSERAKREATTRMYRWYRVAPADGNARVTPPCAGRARWTAPSAATTARRPAHRRTGLRSVHGGGGGGATGSAWGPRGGRARPAPRTARDRPRCARGRRSGRKGARRHSAAGTAARPRFEGEPFDGHEDGHAADGQRTIVPDCGCAGAGRAQRPVRSRRSPSRISPPSS
jgi:hypothetical protein